MNRKKSFLLLLVILLCSAFLFCKPYKLKVDELVIDVSGDLQLLDQPREGMKPPFIFTGGIPEDDCVLTKDEVESVNAGSMYNAKIQKGLESKFNVEFLAELAKDAAISSSLGIELANRLQFNIEARGIKLFSVAPSSVEFKGGTDCISYISSFKKKNRLLVLETLAADTLAIIVSNLENQTLKTALLAKYIEVIKGNIEFVNKAHSTCEYKITGHNLVFGYRGHSFVIQLYSTKKPLKITVPLNKEFDLTSVSDIKWIRALRVESTGDGQSYIVTLYPFLGNKIIKRMEVGDQKDFSIEKHQKITVTLSDVSNKGLELAVAGFKIAMKE